MLFRSNLVSGTDLIKAICGDDAKVFGITSPLITKADGSKFGKSEGGNVWLDPEKTSAYEFYQFWVNVGDAEICTLLRRLSMRDPEEIMKLEESVRTEPEKRLAQKALAEELTAIVHGPEGLAKAQKITETLFSGSIMDLTADELREGLKDAAKCEVEDGMPLIDAMIAAGAATSGGRPHHVEFECGGKPPRILLHAEDPMEILQGWRERRVLVILVGLPHAPVDRSHVWGANI